MSPFQESEAFPRGRRLLLVPVAMLFLLGPYGSMMSGGPSDPVKWVVTMLSIAVCTVVLALGIASPRRRVVVDPQDRSVTIASTPPPPHFAQVRETRSFDDVTGIAIHEVGIAKTGSHGYRVVIDFREAPDLHLRLHATRDGAQDTIDHLVLLGLPGHSRAAERNALLDAPKPITWL